MLTPLSVAKAIGGPGSLGFLVAGSLLGLALVRWWPRGRALGRLWITTLYLAYVILALPPVARQIAAPFADELAGRRRVQAAFDAVIVFDGDNRRGRVQETARLWRASHQATVIVSGEPWLERPLREAGIPGDRLVREKDSRTTRDQVAYVRAYAARHPDARIAVVASRLQIPRIAGLIHGAALTVTLYGAPVDKELNGKGVWRYLPSYAALRISRDALYERIALVYYRWKGWIDDPISPSPR